MGEERRIGVAHVGPDAQGRGGMAAVTRALVDTELARQFRLQPITTHVLGGRARRTLTFARGLGGFVRWARGPGVRIAHVHATVRGSLHRKVVIVAAARLLRIPVLIQIHAGAAELAIFHASLDPVRRRLIGAALRSANQVLAVSTASARELEQRFGVHAVQILPNPAPRLGRPREGGHEPAEVVYLGGFANPVKGADVLLRALPTLRSIAPGVHVTLAGPGEPPPAATATMAGDPLVTWAGWLDGDAKAAALSRAAAVVLPSISEGLPMALLEAMAAGAPIVATRVGGIPDVAVDGRQAVLVEPGDAAGLADAIATLVNDPAYANRLGEAAREGARALSPDAVAERLADLYGQVANRGRENRS